MLPTLLDVKTLLNPFPLFRMLREASPVLFVEPLGAWLALKYADVKRIYVDHAAFSSKNPMQLPADSPLAAETLVFSDPPNHTRFRAMAVAPFTARRVAIMKPHIASIVQKQLASLPDEGFDFVAGFSGPIPALIIAQILGIPAADQVFFKNLVGDVVLIGTVGHEAKAHRALRVLSEYLSQLLDEKRQAPDDALLSAWLRGESSAQPATPEEIISLTTVLLVAGHESTTNLLSNAVRIFSEHPEARPLLADPEKAALVLDEVLRYRGPLSALPRRTVTEVTLSGVTIPSGSLVLGMLGAANRDPEVFADPDRFEPLRASKGGLAFGAGIHRCLGEPLARLEALLALPALYRRFPELQVDPTVEPEPVISPLMHGVRTLRVQTRARRPRHTAGKLGAACGEEAAL